MWASVLQRITGTVKVKGNNKIESYCTYNLKCFVWVTGIRTAAQKVWVLFSILFKPGPRQHVLSSKSSHKLLIQTTYGIIMLIQTNIINKEYLKFKLILPNKGYLEIKFTQKLRTWSKITEVQHASVTNTLITPRLLSTLLTLFQTIRCWNKSPFYRIYLCFLFMCMWLCLCFRYTCAGAVRIRRTSDTLELELQVPGNRTLSLEEQVLLSTEHLFSP